MERLIRLLRGFDDAGLLLSEFMDEAVAHQPIAHWHTQPVLQAD